MQFKKENTDLIVLKAFLNDIKQQRGISTYRLCKEANMRPNYLNHVERNLKGKSGFRKTIKLSFVLYLSELFNYPFDLSKYIHLIEDTTQDNSTGV